MTDTRSDTVEADALMDTVLSDALTEEERADMLISMSDIVFKGTLVRLIERMDEPTREAFAALVEKEAPAEEIGAFLKERVPDADGAVAEAVRELADDFAALADVA